MCHYQVVGGTELGGETACQTPIDGFVVWFTLPVDGTVQEEAWAPDIYVRKDEVITVAQNTTQGNPITYETDWGDGDANIDTEEVTGTHVQVEVVAPS